jgi:hypothetical protein
MKAMTAHFAFFLLAVVMAATSCSGPSLSARRAIVEKSAVRLGSGDLPTPFLDEVGSARVLFFGETHYVAEHQAMLARLAVALGPRGFGLVLNEGMAADSFLDDAYVQGLIGELPRSARAFDGAWLDVLRAHNAGLPPSDRIHVGLFDMDHFGDEFGSVVDFCAGLLEAREPAKAVALRGLFAGIKAGRPAGGLSSGEADAFVAGLGPLGLEAWMRGGLADAARAELASVPLREKWSDEGREAFIAERIASFVAAYPGSRIVVNCGMNHAQKEAFLSGPKLDYARTRIAALPAFKDDPAAAYSLAALPLRGEGIDHFYDKDASSYDLAASSDPAGLIRLLGEAGGGGPAFLSLRGGDFRSTAWVWQDRWSSYRLKPGAAFDGLLVYPEGHIPSGLAVFRR